MTDAPVIEASDLVRVFTTGVESVVAVDHVTLAVRPGEFVCVYGASGSGKSTLLNLLAGLDVPDAGEVIIAGAALSRLSESKRARLRLESIGVVFQEHNLLDELTAAENVMLPLLARRMPKKVARDEAHTVLSLVGIDGLGDRRPREMSGGQRQRVGIARAFAGGRRLLLADEPTGALDAANSAALFDELRRVCDEKGFAAVVATHDPLARSRADRVLSMLDGTVSDAP